MTNPLLDSSTVTWRLLTELGLTMPVLRRMDDAAVFKKISGALRERGVELPSVLVRGDTSILSKLLDQAIANRSGGTSSRPDWVPANAKIHIDLVGGSPQGRAYVDGVGVVAVDTLLGSDPNTENAWDTTSYDPDSLTANGYVGGDVALIGAARTAILGSVTAVIKTKQVANAGFFSGLTPLVLVAANGNDALELDFTGNYQAAISSWGGSLFTHIDHILNSKVIGSVNCVAMTIDESRWDIAANGSVPVTGIIGSSDRPAGNPLVAALLEGNGFAIQSITIYDALPSTAGLSALSETGAVNTAPTGITLTWAAGYLTVVSPTEATIPAGTISGVLVLAGLNTFSGSDPEGNPLSFSIAPGNDARVNWYNAGAGVPVPQPPSEQLVLANPDDFNGDLVLEAGTINFTIRATDPSDLYVDQTFTITVTA